MNILSIDQGTTGTTTVLYDQQGRMVGKAYRRLSQIFPRPGWVEHDPVEIWRTVVEGVEELCSRRSSDIAAVGITNQRETTVLWDRRTGDPLYNAIVWQCRRTADTCEALREHESLFRERTGLPVDPYFSGTKVKWMLGNVVGSRFGDVVFGTIDTWLIWKLTGGRIHATDYTNAARTLLFDIRKREWDEELCRLLEIPSGILPEVRRSVGDYGVVESIPAVAGTPILAVAGDQQAALFGQTCFRKGQIKNTYGTGCFVVMNTGSEAVFSRKGLITTLAVDGTGAPCYALEGSIFIAGAVIEWLRDEVKIIEHVSDSESLALSVENNGGVYLVPAFVGLGAPHWNPEVRGVLVGLTRGTNRNHIVRAALESMAYQTHDVLVAMEQESRTETERLAVDGGAAVNDFLMQFQADIIGRPVVRPALVESTSLGVAFMAGLRAGIWKDSDELRGLKRVGREFRPSMDETTRLQLLQGWQKALRQAMIR